MLKLVLVALVSLGASAAGAAEEQYTASQVQPKFPTPCTTPNREAGVCVEIQKCRILMEVLESGRNESYSFIRESRCGPLNQHQESPKVCCGYKADYVNATTTRSTPTTTTTMTTTTTTPAPTTKGPKTPQKNPFPQHCGNHTVPLASRIFGGTRASLGEFPWMARLRHRRKEDGQMSYGCSGFLISEQFVLTAAHCIRSKALAPLGPLYQVLLGEHDMERNPDCVRSFGEVLCANPPQYRRTAKPIVHPEYSDSINHYNDIALIPLKEHAKLSAYVYPICLSKQLSNKTEMWLSGWGKTETREENPIKLKVSIPRANSSHCARLYSAVEVTLLASQICAGGEAGRDSCSGDSGGPIMVQTPTGTWNAEGIVSFGLGCGLEGWPGIYTNIPNYMLWIKKAANRYVRKHGEDPGQAQQAGVKH